MSEALLQFEDVRFAWPGERRDTLDIADLRVEPSERVLVRGHSGCGKSTLLSLSAGVLLATSGNVRFMGQDWKSLRMGARDQRRVDHVGYIFQQFNLLPYLSVVDNVLMPCRFSQLRAKRASGRGTIEEAAQALLDGLGLPRDAWSRSASALSVGQQQRVAAARALIGHPEIVIADEPTSALDEERRDAFMELLLRRCEEASSALVFVSHDARLARHFGRVVELPAVNRAAVAPSEV
ncbi:MAG: ABC transporter ATP-binding protein [Burkholderiales bacterium]